MKLTTCYEYSSTAEPPAFRSVWADVPFALASYVEEYTINLELARPDLDSICEKLRLLFGTMNSESAVWPLLSSVSNIFGPA